MIQVALLLIALLCPRQDAGSWRYPNLGAGTSGNVKTDGKVVGQSFSLETRDDFGKVLAWYAKRAHCEGPEEAYKGFRNRKPGDAPAMSGSAESVVVAGGDSGPKSSAIYSFTDKHMQATFLVPESRGNRVVTISIASNGKLTTVNVLTAKM